MEGVLVVEEGSRTPSEHCRGTLWQGTGDSPRSGPSLRPYECPPSDPGRQKKPTNVGSFRPLSSVKACAY